MKRAWRYCDHCDEEVSNSTWFRHKKNNSLEDATYLDGPVFSPERASSAKAVDDVLDKRNSEINIGVEEKQQQINIECILSEVDSFMLRIDEHGIDLVDPFLTNNMIELDKMHPCSTALMKKRKSAIQYIQAHLRRIDQQKRTGTADRTTYISSEDSSSDESIGRNDVSDDDSGTEDWQEMDRDQFISELLANDQEQRVNRSHLEIRDNSAQGKVINLITWLCYFLYTWKCINAISDNALDKLMYFLYHLFKLMTLQDQFLAAALHIFPASIYALRKMLMIDRDDFERIVVCPKCTTLYPQTDLFSEGNGIPSKLQCTNIIKKTKKYTTRCGSKLFKTVALNGGHIGYYPLKTYCYKSIVDSIEHILSRPGIVEQCEKWRTRATLPGHLGDIYDGDIWKSFQTVGGQDFLAKPFSYAFQLNVDWFQPFPRRKDVSVGVIYLALLNLPLNLRFKRENIIIAGIIPNLDKEPSLNNFLNPLVVDLQHLWKGVRMSIDTCATTQRIRAAVLCCAADIPAARKLCGFLGHAATFGCSKCMKKFSGGFGEGRNYSGFDRENWPIRMYRDHLRAIHIIERCKNVTSKRKQETASGWRFSPLTQLEYFNSVLHHVVDPMHNLFLGTAKTMFKFWVKLDILTKDKLKLLDANIRSFQVSGELGRLPNNISSNWGGFTAEQWKTWTLVYSVYVLHDVLPSEHYKCWHTFVTACRKIVSPIVSETDARIADLMFIKFGKEVEHIYGEHSVTPNMHLHCHLYDSIKSYGSMYVFWLFSFERYNGMLEKYNTNRKENFEIQLMREFLTTNQLIKRSICATLDDEHGRELLPIARNMSNVQSLNDSVDTTLLQWKLAVLPLTDLDNWSDLNNIEFHRQKKQIAVDCDDLALLRNVYGKLYPNSQVSDMAITIFKFNSIHINSNYYSSKAANRENYSRILANWINEDGQIDEYSSKPKPGRVKFFFSHTAAIDSIRKRHCFACIDWHRPYIEGVTYAQPVTTWYKGLFYRGTNASFMPVQRIHSRFAGVELRHDDSEILVVCPLYKKV